MAADNEMTIVIRARDQATAVVKSVGGNLRGALLGPLAAIGRSVGGIVKQFFGLKALLVGGGFVAIFGRMLTSLAPNADKFEPLFSEETQGKLNATASAWSKLGATIQSVFGRIIANQADNIEKALSLIAQWFIRNKDNIETFFIGTASAIQTSAEILAKAVTTYYIIKGFITGRDDEPRPNYDRIKRDLDVLEERNASELAKAQGDEWVKMKDAARAAKPAVEALTTALGHYLVTLQEIADTMANSVTNALLSFVEGTRTAAQAMRDMVRSMLQSLGQLFVNRAFQSIFGSLIGATPLGPLLGFAGNNPIAGARAGGGPVAPGGTYLVGENGPELLRMGSRGGFVHPNAGGSFSVVNNFYGAANPAQVEAATSRALSKLIETNGSFRRKLRSA